MVYLKSVVFLGRRRRIEQRTEADERRRSPDTFINRFRNRIVTKISDFQITSTVYRHSGKHHPRKIHRSHADGRYPKTRSRAEGHRPGTGCSSRMVDREHHGRKSPDAGKEASAVTVPACALSEPPESRAPLRGLRVRGTSGPFHLMVRVLMRGERSPPHAKTRRTRRGLCRPATELRGFAPFA